MKNQKVKELKDDAILDIKVNKTFYLMSKAALFSIFKEIHDISKGDPQEFIKNITSSKYEELNDKERTFYTLTLLIGEIEKQAIEKDAYVEKDIDIEALKEELKNAEDANED